MSRELLALVESNTTGTGRHFARNAVLLGIEPVLITCDPERYPYVREDGVRHVLADTSHEQAVFDAVSALNQEGTVVGVTSSSDYYIATAAQVARRLGLPGPPPEAVVACRDKGTQRRVLEAAGVPGPRFTVVSHIAEAVTAAQDIGFPVVLKPVQGSGSLGVRLCADAGQVHMHAAELLGATVNERGLAADTHVLVEEALAGDEFSVEVFDGCAVAVVAKHLTPHPHFVEIGHDVPASIPGGVAGSLTACAESAAAALGLVHGAVHVELRIGSDGPRLIEVNPRLAGGMIPELLRRARGVDLVRAQVVAALGRPADLTHTQCATASIRFVTADEDAVVGWRTEHTMAAARAVNGVVEVTLYKTPGTPVRPPQDFRDRLGHVIAVADTPQRSHEAAETAVRGLRTALVTSTTTVHPGMEASLK
ncbi:ATP-grasp domain-containing protein [Streptomyces sp. NPDC087658]|uniref:ATP-grasp domain-containing protein n=1 Tax=Streptomyces sp. NPDC087658 TaxID=3365800 RepID=UPI0037FFEBD1